MDPENSLVLMETNLPTPMTSMLIYQRVHGVFMELICYVYGIYIGFMRFIWDLYSFMMLHCEKSMKHWSE